jgi:uncharacterized membrane protein
MGIGELKNSALKTLEGRWAKMILALVLYGIIQSVSTGVPYLGVVVAFFISGPLVLGITRFVLKYSRNEDVDYGEIFSGFNFFGTAFCANLIKGIFIFLWSLLLIIPGIIASISYSLTFYIIADNPEIKSAEAIDLSKKMMYGYKEKYFLMQLSFIGWAILAVIPCCLGYLWLAPYIQVTTAKFYEEVKANYEREHVTVLNNEQFSDKPLLDEGTRENFAEESYNQNDDEEK